MANIAKQDVSKTQREEVNFFSAYLQDRIEVARKLGLLKDIIRNPTMLLEIVEKITYEQGESIGEKSDPPGDEERKAAIAVLSNPSTYRQLSALERGDFALIAYGESYTTFRWHFPWEQYIVIGAPDGITKDFVYEFKSTESARYINQRIKQANAQADLYGFFFERDKKRVQVYCFETKEMITDEGPVDMENAVQFLKKFRRSDNK